MSKNLNAGDVFRRKHGFVRPWPGYPRQDIWWSATSNRPATAFGRLAIVREWWIDPDGNEVEPTQDWIPDKEKADIREHRNVLRSITSKKMEAVGRVAKEAVEEIDDADRYAGLDLVNVRVLGTA